MKCITLTEPWALLLATGAKEYETRGWSPRFPIPSAGVPMAIHAAQGLPPAALATAHDEPFITDIHAAGYEPETLPRGAVLAIGRLMSAQRVTPANTPTGKERMYGGYSLAGGTRYMWRFADVRLLARPVRASGALFVWEWDVDAPEPPATPQRAQRPRSTHDTPAYYDQALLFGPEDIG